MVTPTVRHFLYDFTRNRCETGRAIPKERASGQTKAASIKNPQLGRCDRGT